MPADPSANPPPTPRSVRGAPVGRRVFLGVAALGAAGVFGGSYVQDALARWLAPLEQRDPTGTVGLFPLGDTFRFYSVTGPVPQRTATNYRLTVGGRVAHPLTYTLAELQAMPQTEFVTTFHCVTGWGVPDVRWSGVRLAHLLDLAGVGSDAHAVGFRSFDGTYTESLTLSQARRDDVIVALRMQGAPVTHAHGGPVRTYCGSLYGYKSTKWLSGIDVMTEQQPGYWETRGYALDGTVQR